jgi:glycine cleavage system aminomethyltransferase T
MVSRDKDDYIGAEAVKAGLAEEPRRRLIGVTMDRAGASPTSGPALDSEILRQGIPIGVLANTGYSYQLAKQISGGTVSWEVARGT